MSTIVPEVAEYTGVVPNRTQSQSDFNDNVDDFLNYIDTFGPDLNDTVEDLNLAVGEVNTDAATASAAADNAIASANATLWNSSTTYNEGDVVISDGDAFIAVEGNTNDYPNDSVTGKWNQITTNTQNVIDRIDARLNLLWNPDFTVNQERDLTAAPGTYSADFWFCPNEEISPMVHSHAAGGIIVLGDGAATGGVYAQLIDRRTFSDGGGSQVGGIFEDDWVTISADIESGFSMEVRAGYGTASGSNLTTVKVGDLTPTNREIKFQVDYNSSLTNYLAIKLVPTAGASPYQCKFKNLKLNIGQKATPYEQPNNEEQLGEANRWYYRSYEYGTSSGSAGGPGVRYGKNWSASSQTAIANVPGNIPKMRAIPSVTIYSSNDGASGNVYDIGAATNRSVSSISGLGSVGFTFITLGTGIPAGNNYGFHFTADARL